GQSGLHLAAAARVARGIRIQKQSEEVIDYFLNHGVKIDQKTNEGVTALVLPLVGGTYQDYEFARYLLSRGADANQIFRGQDLFTYAFEGHHSIQDEDAVSAFMSKLDPTVVSKNQYGWILTPVAYDAHRGRVADLQRMLEAGGSVNVPS